MVSAPLFLSHDGHRLLYAVGNGPGQLFTMDPTQPGSETPILDTSTTQMSLIGPWNDETTFSGLSIVNGIHGYLFSTDHPGSATLFSGGTPSNGQIYAHAVTTGGERVFYLRSDMAGRNSDLYRVHMSNAALSVPITDHYTKALGINSFALSGDGTNIFYATLDIVPASSGGFVPGNADVYFLPTSGAEPARHLQHFDEATAVGKFAPDSSYAVIEEGRFSANPALHAFNALDPGQNVRLDRLSGAAGFAEYVFVVAP